MPSSSDTTTTSYTVAKASISDLHGPPRVQVEEARGFMYGHASYRNGNGGTKRTFVMHGDDAQFWDLVGRWATCDSESTSTLESPLDSAATSATSTSTTTKTTIESLLSEFPTPNLDLELNLNNEATSQQQRAPRAPRRTRRHPQPRRSDLNFRSVPPGEAPPNHTFKEKPHLDWAFDQFENTDYSDHILQAFFSMDDSDSDSGSEQEYDTEERIPVPKHANAPQYNQSHTVTDQSLDDFLISWGGRSKGDTVGPGMSGLHSTTSNAYISSLDQVSRPKQAPVSAIRNPKWKRHGRPLHVSHTTRKHAKLTWDIVITYSVGDIPAWVSIGRHQHRGQPKPPPQQYSHLLYKDNIEHEEYVKLVTMKKAMEERSRFVERLVEMHCIILFQYGKTKNERIMKLLFPFETLKQEAEAIELRKTLRPGLVRLNTGRFASDVVASSIQQTAGSDYETPAIAPTSITTAPSKPSIPFTHPYLIYKTESPLDLFRQLFKPPDVDENRHSDHFRVAHLSEFEGGHDLGIPAIKLNFFKPSQRNNLVNSLLTRSTISVTKLIEHGYLDDYFAPNDSLHLETPLPSPSRHKYHTCVRHHLYQSLRWSWKNPLIFISWDPSEEFRFYFGEKIAMYFAFSHFYTKFLWIPSIFGLITLLYGIILASAKGNTYGDALVLVFDNELTPFFTLSMSVWAVLFLELWQRQSSILAHNWNISDFERGEQIRPQWRYGKFKAWNPITQRMELTDPRHRRVLRKFFTSSIVFLCILLNAGIVGCIIIFQSWATAQWTSESFAEVSSSVLSLTCILILSTLFQKLAKFLTDFDNYRTETGYQNALILKNFLLAVVNSFASLFYVGIVKAMLSTLSGGNNLIIGRYSDTCKTFLGKQSCMIELMIQMFITFVGIIICNQIRDLFIPFILMWYRRKYNPSKSLVDHEEQKPNFTDESLGFNYINSVVQFGFITLFSCAFPLAPVFALVSNWFEVRVDAYRLLVQYRRPFASRTQGIGLVHPLMTYISSVGVVTNAIVIAFASTSFDESVVSRFHVDSQLAVRIVFVIAFEHFVGGLRLLVQHFLAPVPKSVRIAVGRRVHRTALENFGEPIEEDDNLQFQGVALV